MDVQILAGRSSLATSGGILAARSRAAGGLARHPFARGLPILACQNAVGINGVRGITVPVAAFAATSAEDAEVTSAILATASATTTKGGSNRLARRMPLEVIMCPFVMAMALLTNCGRQDASNRDAPFSIAEAKVLEVVVRGSVAQEVRRVGHVQVVQVFRMVFSFHRRLSTIFLE